MSDFNTKKYTVGWICATAYDLAAALLFLDTKPEEQPYQFLGDGNTYIVGEMGKHNVVITAFPLGEYIPSTATNVASRMQASFPNVKIVLMVGIGGGAPARKHDIRLGDIVVGSPKGVHNGVLQCYFDQTTQSHSIQATKPTGNKSSLLLTAVSSLGTEYEMKGHQIEEKINGILEKNPGMQEGYKRPDPSSDRLYRTKITCRSNNGASCAEVCSDNPSGLVFRSERTKYEDNPVVHHGLIASVYQPIDDASVRNKLAADKNVLCFQMGDADLGNQFPCLYICGICGYSDSHKNEEWQGYAAMTAAAYAKDLLGKIAHEANAY
jgi:nucleoside phosphorylase